MACMRLPHGVAGRLAKQAVRVEEGEGERKKSRYEWKLVNRLPSEGKRERDPKSMREGFPCSFSRSTLIACAVIEKERRERESLQIYLTKTSTFWPGMCVGASSQSVQQSEPTTDNRAPHTILFVHSLLPLQPPTHSLAYSPALDPC